MSISGFLINAKEMRNGAIPRIRKRIIPGIRKSGKGEFSKIDKGSPPINFPEGEIIRNAPPPIAPKPRNTSNVISIFLAVFGFMAFN